MKKIFSNRIVSVASSVLVSVVAVSLVGYAASTISTDITTDGTLRVTGTFTAKGTAAFDSTSATTTISGGLRADTGDNTLVVDFSSSRVGIGTTSPSALFSVTGATILGGALDVTGAVNFSGSGATTTVAGGFGVATSTPGTRLSVGGDALFGSTDVNHVNFRSGVLNFTSTATTTITTNTAGLGFNINAGDLVLDSSANKLYVGTSTPLRGNLGVDGTGTTTLGVYTTTAAPRGTCIELNNATNGGLMRLYATSSDIGTLRVEPGACTDGS